MKKKLFCCATLFMAAVMLFSGCGAGKISDVKPAKKFSDCFAGMAEASVKTLDLNGYSYIKSRGDAAFFEKRNGLAKTDYAVYYARSGKLLKFERTEANEWAEEAFFGCETANGSTRAVLAMKYTEGEKTEYRFYDGTGALIAVSEDPTCSAYRSYFYCDGAYYFLKNDGESVKTEFTDDVPSAEVYSDKYGAGISTDNFGGKFVYVFERIGGKTVYSFPCDPEISDLSLYFISDGKLLIQEEIKESPVASKYTYIDKDGEKFTVKTKLVTLDGEVKEEKINYPFLINSLTNEINDGKFRYYYDCENVAVVTPIEDYRIAGDAHAKVVIDSDGKAVMRMDNITEGLLTVKPLGNDKWLVTTKTGEAKVMTDDREVLSVWNNESAGNSRFAEAGGILYDLKNGGEINLKNNGYKLVGENGFNAVLSGSDGKHYAYDGNLSEIEDYAGVWELGYFTEKDGKYRYYTDKQALEAYGKIENYLVAENDVIVIYKVSATENGYACIKNFYA